MTINVDLLKTTLAHIEANPADWYQADYRCGSGLCFAGWAAQLAGGAWYTAPDRALSGTLIAEPDEEGAFGPVPNPAVRVVYADLRAQRVLGLTEDQAGELFFGGNTLDDLRTLVSELCEGAA